MKAQKAGYRTVETGPNHRKWSRVVLVTNELGQVGRRTNSFIELSTGLNRKAGANWTESQPELVITNNGVIGRGAQHFAFFAANLHTRGAIQLRTSDGEWIKSHPLCLAYHDSATGTNVVFAAVRDSVAQAGSNEVVYPDAFDGARASVRYKFTRSGVSQDIEFEARPDPPETFGLNPATTHLLAISEFVEFPTPVKKERTWRAGGELRRDHLLKFGSLTMIPGRAFKTPRVRADAGVPVTKSWEIIDGRTVLVERVPYQRITPALLSLPVSGVTLTNSPAAGATNSSINHPGSRRFLAQAGLPAQPKQSVASAAARPVQLVSRPEPNAFVLDWESVNSGYDGSWFYFPCDATTLVENSCYLDGAEFAARAVVKFAPGTTLGMYQLAWDGDVGCGDGQAILTSGFDSTVGEPIPGYSGGSPASGDYFGVMVVDCSSINTARQVFDIRYSSDGIVSACIPTIALSNPTNRAIKGASPERTASFIISRLDGDESQSLPVQVSLSGAAGPDDYSVTGLPAVIQPNESSATITVHPGAAGGVQFSKSIVLTIQPDIWYLINSAPAATNVIEDPSAPKPPPVLAPSAMVGWWRGNGNALDSATINNGTAQNGLGYDYGYVDQGFNFDGVDDALTVADANSLDVGANEDFSIEAWIRPITNTTDYGVQSILDKRYAPDPYRCLGYEFCIVDGRVSTRFSDSILGNGIGIASDGPDLRDGRFHHVAVSIDRDSPAGGKLYADGVVVYTFDPRDQSGDLSNSEPLLIGKHPTAGLHCDFTGIIDEISVYKRALSSTEVQSIFAAGRGGKFTVSPANDADGDGIPDWFDANSANSSIGMLKITIDNPPNGAVVP